MNAAHRLTAGFVSAFFAFAAITKVVEPTGLYLAVRRLLRGTGIGSDAIWTLVGVVIAVELVVGAMLLLRPSRGWVLFTGVVLLAFTAVLVRILSLPTPFRCGCLGLAGSLTPRQEALLGIAPNVGMLGCLAVWWLLARRVAAGRTHGERTARAAPGFSLIELLVVIAVFAVLVALAAPSLRSARFSGNRTAEMLNMRQVGAAVANYSNDARGGLPSFGVAQKPWLGYRVGNLQIGEQRYFAQSWLYVHALMGTYYDGDWRSLARTWDLRARRVTSADFQSRFGLTHTAQAVSRFWRDPIPDDLTLYTPQRLDQVLFPSRKGLLVDLVSMIGRPGTERNEHTLISLADGHARTMLTAKAEENVVDDRPYEATTSPIMTTRGGFEGWDLESGQ